MSDEEIDIKEIDGDVVELRRTYEVMGDTHRDFFALRKEDVPVLVAELQDVVDDEELREP